MSEELAIGIVLGIFIYLISSRKDRSIGSIFSPGTVRDIDQKVTKIDDKNWIVNGKFVSLEEDTPVSRMQQQQEDDRHYYNYERYKLNCDRERISEIFFETKKFISAGGPEKFAELNITGCDSNSEVVKLEYDQYVKMVNKLKEGIYLLTYEEFIIQKDYPMWCCPMKIWFPPFMSFYNIYNEKTARYNGGNMNAKMEKEFKDKWY